MASVFTKIINGELPAHRVYEDDKVLALLALDQVQLGHTLVIPKKEVDHFFDCPEPDYSEVFQVAKKLSAAIQKARGSQRVAAIIAGFEVPHFHLHLIPVNHLGEVGFANAQQHSSEVMAEVCEQLKAALSAEV